MKVAAVSIARERRVGQITADGRALVPSDPPISEAEDGILALIRRIDAGLPPTPSPVPLNQAALEAPIPQPRPNIFCVGKNYHEHAHEFVCSGFDTSNVGRPMGPVEVTREKIDIVDTPSSCYINGELRQLILDIPTIIETLSAGTTLQPGDVIVTGTPAGVGIGYDPPKYLRAGEVVRIEIGGIGVLENEVVERSS